MTILTLTLQLLRTFKRFTGAEGAWTNCHTNFETLLCVARAMLFSEI